MSEQPPPQTHKVAPLTSIVDDFGRLVTVEQRGGGNAPGFVVDDFGILVSADRWEMMRAGWWPTSGSRRTATGDTASDSRA